MSHRSYENTLVLLKPDALERGLTGEIVRRIERTGLQIIGLRLMMAELSRVEEHYAEHLGKPFYDDLLALLTRGPVIALVVRGRGAVDIVRKLRGVTDPAQALPGTINGDFAHYLYKGQNLVHASADPTSASREISLWFLDTELHVTDRLDAPATTGPLA